MPLQIPSGVQDGVIDSVVPSLQVGGVLGLVGLTVGGVWVQNALVAGTMGAQCFWLGTTTFYGRNALLVASQRPRTNELELGCSGLAGALAGAVTGMLNKGSSIGRPALITGTLSIAAQAAFHAAKAVKHIDPERVSESFAKVLPLRSLSDNQYETMLQDKLGKINVEISMLDHQIAELKKREAEPFPKAKS